MTKQDFCLCEASGGHVLKRHGNAMDANAEKYCAWHEEEGADNG